MLKKDVRTTYKELRKDLSTDQRKNFSRSIFQETINGFELEGKTISVFLPIKRFLEIDTWCFLEQVKATFCLPVITGENQLKHILYEGKSQIQESDWGIPEPTYGETVAVQDLDVVLVPLLACDLYGYRVGYGKGFYDTFLAKCSPNCLFIGLSYFDPITKIEDLNPADIPLHFCVTPKGVLQFKSK